MHPTARVVLSVGLALALAVARATAQGPVACSKKPIEPCVKRHGRLSTQNGITQRIWLIGTTRMVSPDNDMADLLPPPMGKYLSLDLPDHAYVYGDFEI